jgi:hypothetical protein
LVLPIVPPRNRILLPGKNVEEEVIVISLIMEAMKEANGL